ncbi:MAG: carbon starvation protein A [Candidatus Eisenbacteria bacterium]|uniref:Carbon starvation protein A n=1 Tax=Eiseniibacteriota bacterium TaxID=2212470 RepID=A0A948W2J9_UNCEI|nr:carbon starvation protein A [Candidatus Eisenbacteria bacterium]MBU1951008.1 carbon starvation protein A [Candidatus Eisenbacteria bacterium]MBU2690037.1 carbon starvation protein A [Candidatus Eisenbacteria bacterium]
MAPVLITLICFVIYLAGYHLYARYLARHLFELDATAKTPAHTMTDGIDYVPTRKGVLFGHHFASIAGLSPMLGPAIAVIWGWVPALIWIVFGTVFIGAVHDFSTLVVSIRRRGTSIGKVAEDIMGPRAKSLFHIIIFFLISLAMGVFAYIVATLFSSPMPPAAPSNVQHPEAVVPTASLMILAVIVGFLVYKKQARITPLTIIAFIIMLIVVVLGLGMPILGVSRIRWTTVLLVYCFLASVLPVWLLLQPRDYLNSLLLFLGLGLMYLGFFATRPSFAAPALQLHPEGAPPLFPFVFITIACGAVSGFHGLVSSGTTAKQLNRETDAQFIGYGAMIGESLLGLIAVLACTCGFASMTEWSTHYASWNAAEGLGPKMAAFISGAGTFLGSVGIPRHWGEAFISLIAISFALTSMDSGTRLLRFNLNEVGDTLGISFLKNRYISSALAAGAIGFFALLKVPMEVGGVMQYHPAGLALWALFGTTNQILGGLSLLAVTLYLWQKRKPIVYTLIPMIFMLITTLIAMVQNLGGYIRDGKTTLVIIGGLIFFFAVWLAVEAVIRLVQYSRGKVPPLSF